MKTSSRYTCSQYFCKDYDKEDFRFLTKRFWRSLYCRLYSRTFSLRMLCVKNINFIASNSDCKTDKVTV